MVADEDARARSHMLLSGHRDLPTNAQDPQQRDRHPVTSRTPGATDSDAGVERPALEERLFVPAGGDVHDHIVSQKGPRADFVARGPITRGR